LVGGEGRVGSDSRLSFHLVEGERYLTFKDGYFYKNILVSIKAVSFLLTFWEESCVRLIDRLHLNQRLQNLCGIGKIVPVSKHHAMYAYM
jgi:hypothetical protein